jgi:retron-type reverse transcriptase
VARTDREARFTALLHHVDVDRLRAAYWALKPKAAAGVDGVTWEDYGHDLEANLRDLDVGVHRGSYRAKPSRRVFIQRRTGGCGRSASLRLRTRSFSGRSSRC